MDDLTDDEIDRLAEHLWEAGHISALSKDTARILARSVIAADRAKGGEAVAYIQHHKEDHIGDDLIWGRPDGKHTPLFTRPSPAPETREGLSEEQRGLARTLGEDWHEGVRTKDLDAWCCRAASLLLAISKLSTSPTQAQDAEQAGRDVLASFVYEVYMGAYKPEELQERSRVALITAADLAAVHAIRAATKEPS